MGNHLFSKYFPHSRNTYAVLIRLNNNIILISLCHELNVKLYVELNMNVKIHFDRLESKRVGKKRVQVSEEKMVEQILVGM